MSASEAAELIVSQWDTFDCVSWGTGEYKGYPRGEYVTRRSYGHWFDHPHYSGLVKPLYDEREGLTEKKLAERVVDHLPQQGKVLVSFVCPSNQP